MRHAGVGTGTGIGTGQTGLSGTGGDYGTTATGQTGLSGTRGDYGTTATGTGHGYDSTAVGTERTTGEAEGESPPLLPALDLAV